MATSVLAAKSQSSFLTSTAQRKVHTPYGFPATDDCTNCGLRSDRFFCSLSTRSARNLENIRRTSSYPSGAILFMEGEAARGVYIICQGRVKLLTTNSEGKTLIFKIAKPGEILGLNATLSGTTHEITAETLQPAQLAYISREDFLRFIKDNGDACLQVAQHLGRDCHSAYEVIRSIGLSNSVEEKLARFLVEWSSGGQMAGGVMRVKLALTHEEIAQLIGCSRESVSRSFSEFKRRRIVEVNGATLLVQDKVALETLAMI
ncbi:MAG TPA: Crp/Fnr family transcriptional regulator [Candidatus Limnocylindrales bacterium]|nr:Crp/Fnr family transcriptional regulator [Candidatus Limnocylindrales bacterium]